MFRRNFNRYLTALTITVLFFSGSFSAFAAKYYTQDEIKIKAKINPDGSLNIEESRTYNFHGKFSWADYRLPLGKLGEVTEFSLSESGQLYLPSDSQQPGTYIVSQSKNLFFVKWYYKASSETKTFTLKYRVTDAVKVYNDVAEFYYQFVSAEKPKKVGRVSVDLFLPRTADTSEVRAWLHTSLNGFYHFIAGKIHFEASPLPLKKFFEVRVTFPTDWVPEARIRINRNYRQVILNEEKRFAEEANRLRQKFLEREEFKRKYGQKARQLNILLVVIGLLLFYYLYNRYGKAYTIPGLSRVTSEAPENISPAMANFIILNGQVGSGAILGTLFDLASRGFIKINEKVEQRKFLFLKYEVREQTLILDRDKYQAESHNLLDHEREYIQFFFDDLAQGQNSITTTEIKKNRAKVMKWVRNWKKTIKKQWGDRPFFDKSSLWATFANAVYGLIVVAVGIYSVIAFGTRGIIGVTGGLILMNISFLIIRYTKEAKSLRLRLMALKNYLKKYEYRKNTATLQNNFSRYFSMAVALGIGAAAMKKLIEFAAQDSSMNYFPYYYTSAAHTNPADFAKSVSSFITSVSSTMASASGTGGGASSGGGGGAGGASGGAG